MNSKANYIFDLGITNKTVEWIHKKRKTEETPLMARYPRQKDKINKIRAFTVKEHERAILLNNGEFISELEGGTYELDRHTRKPGTEIIWFDTTIQKIQWGVPQIQGITTKDGFQIGMFGDLKLHIVKSPTFYKYVVGGTFHFTQSDLKDWIKSLIHTSIRDLYRNYIIKDILKTNRQPLIQQITGKMAEELYSYGLMLDSFNVLGFKAPPAATEVIKSDQFSTLLTHEVNRKTNLHHVGEVDSILNRIKSLKNRIANFQDQLITNQLTQEEFNKKTSLLEKFIDESQRELKKEQKAVRNSSQKEGN